MNGTMGGAVVVVGIRLGVWETRVGLPLHFRGCIWDTWMGLKTLITAGNGEWQFELASSLKQHMLWCMMT